jgi:hypothetical protein
LKEEAVRVARVRLTLQQATNCWISYSDTILDKLNWLGPAVEKKFDLQEKIVRNMYNMANVFNKGTCLLIWEAVMFDLNVCFNYPSEQMEACLSEVRAIRRWTIKINNKYVSCSLFFRK